MLFCIGGVYLKWKFMKKTLVLAPDSLFLFYKVRLKFIKIALFLLHAEFKNCNRDALHSATERRRISSGSGRS